MTAPNLHSDLRTTIDNFLPEVSHISEERTQMLEPLIAFCLERKKEDLPIHLNFICTHNSRRSHISQVWANVAAKYFKIPKVITFSGGTEATALNPRAVATLERDGFVVMNPGGDNPNYTVSFAANVAPMVCFSKKYDHSVNTSKDFAAIMTCNDADKNCPVIAGATRISLPYVDPKEADGTSEEEARYTERSTQIAVEMFTAFREVARR